MNTIIIGLTERSQPPKQSSPVWVLIYHDNNENMRHPEELIRELNLVENMSQFTNINKIELRTNSPDINSIVRVEGLTNH